MKGAPFIFALLPLLYGLVEMPMKVLKLAIAWALGWIPLFMGISKLSDGGANYEMLNPLNWLFILGGYILFLMGLFARQHLIVFLVAAVCALLFSSIYEGDNKIIPAVDPALNSVLLYSALLAWAFAGRIVRSIFMFIFILSKRRAT